jgi:hypothetical protein
LKKNKQTKGVIQMKHFLRSILPILFVPSLLIAQPKTTSVNLTSPITPTGRISCPEGFTLIGTAGSTEAYCISSKKESAATWLNANIACRGKTPKARLCSASEWVAACVDGKAGPNNMTGHWEWVADLYDDHGQAMGNPGCDSSYAYRLFSEGSYRCCFR